RLRFGDREEAFWSDYFNGIRSENRWVSHVPAGQRPRKREQIEILGIEVGHWYEPIGLGRRFMARFGDISRIDSSGQNVRVTLKSGAVFDVDRFSANDLDNGVRVWDGTRGAVDLDGKAIRTIQFLPTPTLGEVPRRLHGTVRTRQGEFSGFIRWDRDECVGSDQLDGRTATGELSVPFDSIRSIARQSRDSSLVTLLDGREIALSGTREVGHQNRGIYVDDVRYGRVVISAAAFERIDFSSPAGSGPAYGEFPAGRALTGIVTTRAGRRLAGRLVYDLDESETAEVLDSASQGVEYAIPFGLIASLTPCGREERGASRAKVVLHAGEELQCDCAPELGEANAGMLIFVDGHPRPQYVPWGDVREVHFDRPAMMYPPIGVR
ncbi:MAG TPA: hypothetical protein VFL80_06140, partial [Thermoanaerobaculia bacterium]|nr:hypothetical protein [Thermoanaerobaculia bacterium]